MKAGSQSVPTWAGQEGYGARFQWGSVVTPALGDGICVVVDVLRFTTAVEAAVTRGVAVYPYRWRDDTAPAFAAAVHALLADGHDPAGPSLSPSSMDELSEKGWHADIGYAAQLNVSSTVPVLINGAFR